MARRRIGYGLALALAVLFVINYTGFLAWFTLVLCLCLPLLSLLVSLPALLGCRVEVRPHGDAVERGGQARWRVTVAGGAYLPFARCTLRIETVNRLTGAGSRRKAMLSGSSREVLVEEPADTAHCGALECRVTQVRAVDCLGLFALRRPAPPPAEWFVLPIPAAGAALVLPQGAAQEGTTLKPRPGGGPGEDYDLRPYRPGDPMRSIHWKLSSKKDDLVVRETLEPHRPTLVLTFDHFGTHDALDATLDRLMGLSRALLERDRPHVVQWAEPVSGQVRSYPISDEAGLLACLRAALSDPGPASGRSVLDAPIRVPGREGALRHFHVTGGEGAVP